MLLATPSKIKIITIIVNGNKNRNVVMQEVYLSTFRNKEKRIFPFIAYKVYDW